MLKIKEGYLMREIAGSYIVIPVGEKRVEFNGVLTLNDTGAFLWKKIESGADSEKALSEALEEEYEVAKDVAEADAAEFIKKLEQKDLLDK